MREAKIRFPSSCLLDPQVGRRPSAPTAPRPHSTLPLLISGLMWVAAGCETPGISRVGDDNVAVESPVQSLLADDGSPFAARPAPAELLGDGLGPPDPPRPIILENYFDVLRIQVPLGSLSESGKIWNHIDESVLSPEMITLLRRNGLRIGLGRSGAWPAVKAILDATDGMISARQDLSFRNPYPLVLELDNGPRDQTLFLYRRDGTLAGASYPNTRNRFRFAHVMNPQRLDEVLVEVTPEVWEDRPKKRVRASAHGYELVPDYRSRIFAELAVRLSVPQDRFLVIGPSEAVARPILIGAVFLTSEMEGRKTETMLFVTPRVFRNAAGD